MYVALAGIVVNRRYVLLKKPVLKNRKVFIIRYCTYTKNFMHNLTTVKYQITYYEIR